MRSNLIPALAVSATLTVITFGLAAGAGLPLLIAATVALAAGGVCALSAF